jgi:hypothetical protein
MKTGNFHGRLNERRIKALQQVEARLTATNKVIKEIEEMPKEQITEEVKRILADHKTYVEKTKLEKANLEGKIKPQDVADSLRSKKWRADRAGLTRNR